MTIFLVAWAIAGLLFWTEWIVKDPPRRSSDFMVDIFIALPMSLIFGMMPIALRLLW